MNLTVAFDISTFIWDEEDFNNNGADYYQLIRLAPVVFEQISLKKIPVLLRGELYELLTNNFPYTTINSINYNYGWNTLSFLSLAKWSVYQEIEYTNVTTNPDLVKKYFDDGLKNECFFQSSHLLNNYDPENKFITYFHFYNSDNSLKIAQNQNSIEIETFQFRSETDILAFFDSYQIKFEHNPKHDKFSSGGKTSPLSCYNERDNVKLFAQKLLENAFFYEGDYYNFDIENEVYVKFVLTGGLIYHGFDLSDSINNVPNVVKKQFNKDGRIF